MLQVRELLAPLQHLPVGGRCSLSLPVIAVARSVMREPRTYGATATVPF